MYILTQTYNSTRILYNEYNIIINFIISCLIYTACYPITDKLLGTISTRYNNYDNNKRYYILSNILKFFVLNILSYFFLSLIYYDLNLFKLNDWINYDKILKNLAAIYVSTDFVSIFLNWNRMKNSTFYHHICTTLSLIYMCSIDFSHNGVNKAISVYGGFSSLAGLVNCFLGGRYLIESKKKIYIFSKICFILYLVICIINWTWQFYYLCNIILILDKDNLYLRFIENLFYCVMLFFWIKDDLILMNFLKKYNYLGLKSKN